MQGGSFLNKTATLNLMLGIFLKLLGFFVIMYSYAETNPIKAQQAEDSLRQRFNISVSLASAQEKDGAGNSETEENNGQSYAYIQDRLEAQFNLLAGEYVAKDDVLVMRVPAEEIISIDENEAENPDFAKELVQILKDRAGKEYAVEMIVSGKNAQSLMRGISIFVEEMADENYPQALLTIGYAKSPNDATVELRIKQVAA